MLDFHFDRTLAETIDPDTGVMLPTGHAERSLPHGDFMADIDPTPEGDGWVVATTFEPSHGLHVEIPPAHIVRGGSLPLTLTEAIRHAERVCDSHLIDAMINSGLIAPTEEAA